MKQMAVVASTGSLDFEAERKAISEATGYVPEGPQKAPNEAYGKIHLVRPYKGHQIHFEQETKEGWGSWSMGAFWSSDCRPELALHIADASLTGIGAMAKNHLTNLKREFKPQFPTELVLSNPDLAKRFRAWGSDPSGLLEREDFVAAMLALPEVDLLCKDGRAALADPLQKSMSPPGGPTALLKLSPEERVEFTIAAHNRMAELLATLW